MKLNLAALAVALCMPMAWAGQAEDWLKEVPGTTLSCVAPKSQEWAGQAAELAQGLPAFVSLAEETLALRASSIRFYHRVLAQRDADQPLTGSDIDNLDVGISALVEKRAQLLRLALRYECWAKIARPSDPHAVQTQALGLSVSLASALLLYDNYLAAIALYRDQITLRQHLNQADKNTGRSAGELNRSAQMFSSAENRQRVRRVLRWYEKNVAPTAQQEGDSQAYVHSLIAQSPAYSLINRPSPVRYLGQKIGVFATYSVDTLSGAKREGINLTSFLFGNTVGLVETRRGKLDGKADVEQSLLQGLKAADILLEKTPFRLTDKLIPAHWGHAALWVGSEAELRSLGIWDHPYVAPHHDAIRQGRGVIEALRSGVELNTARKFLNVDDLAVLRPSERTDAERAKAILQALQYLGKPYDFNFDTEDTRRIFCSELVYLAYGDLKWPTSRVMGRYTITPNDVAMRATGNGPLQVTQLFHDGQAIAPEQRAQRFAALVLASSTKSK